MQLWFCECVSLALMARKHNIFPRGWGKKTDSIPSFLAPRKSIPTFTFISHVSCHDKKEIPISGSHISKWLFRRNSRSGNSHFYKGTCHYLTNNICRIMSLDDSELLAWGMEPENYIPPFIFSLICLLLLTCASCHLISRYFQSQSIWY